MLIGGLEFSAKASDGTDCTAQFETFAGMIGLERLVPNRYSAVLLLDLFGAFHIGRLDPSRVISEIDALEGGRSVSGMKPAKEFRKPPLKGLWHKHYMPEGFVPMAINLQIALRKYGLPWFREQIKEAEKTGEVRYLRAGDPEAIRAITNDVIHGNWVRRSTAGELTGEWIIYAVHEGRNYYLCLGFHDEDHGILRAKIDAMCCTEFPFLNEILGN